MTWEVLKDIGLSEKQARVLHSLLRLQEAKASEIAKASGISRVRVYDILKELYSMGLVRKKKGRPTKYISLAPDEILDRLLDWKREKYEDEKEKILERKDEIEKELSEVREIDDEKRPKNILEFISIGEVSERETNKVIQNSEGEIKIMSEAFDWIDSVANSLRQKDSTVKVLLLNEKHLDERALKSQKQALEKLENMDAEIRFTDEMPLRGCISEKEAVLNVKEKESSNLLRDCIYTNHASFVRAVNIYFDGLWENENNLLTINN